MDPQLEAHRPEHFRDGILETLREPRALVELKKLASWKKPAVQAREFIDGERLWCGTRHHFRPDNFSFQYEALAEDSPVSFGKYFRKGKITAGSDPEKTKGVVHPA